MKRQLIFWGTSSFAADLLKSLSRQGLVFDWIISQPDRPGNRKKMQPSPVKQLAQEKNWPFQQPEKLDFKIKSFLEKEKPALFVVAAYGKILPADLLDLPSWGAINIHASLLPQYRGASPIQSALSSGDKKTGITLIRMNKKMDEGPIITQEEVSIHSDDDYVSLEKKLALKAGEMLPEQIDLWLKGKIKPVPQDHESATYCRLIEKKDGKVDWQRPAETIHNQFRAFSVWPGIFSFWDRGDQKPERIKIFSGGFRPDDAFSRNLTPGQIFSLPDKPVCIKAGIGYLLVNQLQLEGKKILNAADFINGQPAFKQALLN